MSSIRVFVLGALTMVFAAGTVLGMAVFTLLARAGWSLSPRRFSCSAWRVFTRSPWVVIRTKAAAGARKSGRASKAKISYAEPEMTE